MENDRAVDSFQLHLLFLFFFFFNFLLVKGKKIRCLYYCSKLVFVVCDGNTGIIWANWERQFQGSPYSNQSDTIDHLYKIVFYMLRFHC